jgi:hypothetical protein
MKHRIAVGGVAGLALLVGSVVAANDLKSGPQPGDTVIKSFNVINVTGEYAPDTRGLV